MTKTLPAEMTNAALHDARLASAGPYARRGAARSLHFNGDFQSDDLRIAVIGTRQLLPSMTTIAERIVVSAQQEITAARLSILSGLALGCDASAHEAALKRGVHTSAVVINSLRPSEISPSSNRPLAEQIRRAGVILSENPDAPFSRAAYVIRDHVQAQLSAATIAVATSVGGGTLNAMRESILLERPTGLVIPPSREGQAEGYRGSVMILEALRSGNDTFLAHALGVGGKTEWLSSPQGQAHGKLMAGLARTWLRPVGTKEALREFLREAQDTYQKLRR